jgi:hypothetical protein
VSPVRYELGSYIPEDGILHSHRVKTSNLTWFLLDVPDESHGKPRSS